MSTPASPMILCEGVHKSYGLAPVLSGIHFQVQPGETVVLMGPSGCGKSTLLRCISGLEFIDQGQLTVNGVSVHAKTKDIPAFRANVALVFQQFNLFPHLTVLENLTLAPIQVRKQPKEAAIERAKAELSRVQLLDKLHAYPWQLSGGQQQRVAIARSLAMSPTLMLFDEPTSALDPRMTREVMAVIQDIASEGMTTLVVTHEKYFAEKVADTLILLGDGKIQEMGPPQQVMSAPKSVIGQEFFQYIYA